MEKLLTPLRRRVVSLWACALLILLSSGSALAHFNINVTLSNGAVNPPTTPTLVGGLPRLTSSGTATLVVDDDDFQTVDFDTAVFGIDVTGTQTPDPNDNLIAASVHAGPGVSPSTNGPLVWGFFGSTNDDTTAPTLVIQPFPDVGGFIFASWNINEGHGTNLTEQLPFLLSGQAYIEYDTVQFPNGEIRGNIPEPSTASLLLCGVIIQITRADGRGRRGSASV
ncbi:MAG TPA: CHRD domain-containing protein [Tepidisphaeraceae bacterium]